MSQIFVQKTTTSVGLGNGLASGNKTARRKTSDEFVADLQIIYLIGM